MQQRTSYLPAQHPVKSMAGLARQIALPHEYSPERFPSFPALERTALMGFNTPTTLPLPAETPVKVMVSRQAAYPVWAEKPNTSNWSYNVGYETSAIGASATAQYAELGFESNLQTWGVGNRVASADFVGVSGSTALLSYAPIAMDSMTGTIPWVYVPAGSYFSFTVAVRGSYVPEATTTVGFSYDRWASPGESNSIEIAAATTIAAYVRGGTYTAVASVNMWIRPRSISLTSATGGGISGTYLMFITVGPTAPSYASSSTTAGTLTYSTTPSGVAFLPLVEPGEFVNSTLPWYSTRTTAAAFLGTNVSQVLNKGGTILGGRIPPQVEDPFNVTSSYVSMLHPAEKAYLPLETGVYTYCPPSTDLADFWDYTITTVIGIKNCPLYRLDNTALVNVMFLTASAVAESLACNVDWHIEFRTSSALFQIGLSSITLEAFHQAQLALASAGFFFENPEHKSVLSKVIAAVRKVAPSAIGVVNPVAGRAAQLLLSNKPNSKMHTTTTKRSGYDGPAKTVQKPAGSAKPYKQNKKKGGKKK